MGDITKRLAAYSALAATFIVMQPTEAQVVYHDIDPDVVLDTTPSYADFDMDMNGTSDIGFGNDAFTFYNYSFNSSWYRRGIGVGFLTPANALAGVMQSYIDSYGTFYRYFPYALAERVVIGSDLSWQNWPNQIMALLTFRKKAEDPSHCYYCDWYGFYIPNDIQDHYLGVRFVDSYSRRHYGWVRCDVIDSGRILIIKDYAYEQQINVPIVAGSKQSYVPPHNADIYAYNNNIHINLISSINTPQVTVYDITGKLIYRTTLTEHNNTIPLTIATGIYIVEIQDGDERWSKKVLVE